MRDGRVPFVYFSFTRQAKTHNPSPSGRNPYTESDDRHLIAYIAKHGTLSNRSGNQIYKQLGDNVDNIWPWSSRHPWQSWRDRYCKNKDWFDRAILKHMKVKEKVSKQSTSTSASSRSEAAPIASTSTSTGNVVTSNILDDSSVQRKRKRESLVANPTKPDKRAKISPDALTLHASETRTMERQREGSGSQLSQPIPGREEEGSGSESGSENESEGTVRRTTIASDDYSGEIFESRRHREEDEDESEDDDVEDDKEVDRMLSDAVEPEEIQETEGDEDEEDEIAAAEREGEPMYTSPMDLKGKGKAKATDVHISVSNEEDYEPLYPSLGDISNSALASTSSSAPKITSSKSTQTSSTSSPHVPGAFRAVSASGTSSSTRQPVDQSNSYSQSQSHSQRQSPSHLHSDSQHIPSKYLQPKFVTLQSMINREKELEADSSSDSGGIFGSSSPPATPTLTNVSLGNSTTGRARGSTKTNDHGNGRRSSADSQHSHHSSSSSRTSTSTARPHDNRNPNVSTSRSSQGLSLSYHRGVPTKLVANAFGGHRLVGGKRISRHQGGIGADDGSDSSSSPPPKSAVIQTQNRQRNSTYSYGAKSAKSSSSSSVVNRRRDSTGRNSLERNRESGEVGAKQGSRNDQRRDTFKAARRPSKVYSRQQARAYVLAVDSKGMDVDMADERKSDYSVNGDKSSQDDQDMEVDAIQEDGDMDLDEPAVYRDEVSRYPPSVRADPNGEREQKENEDEDDQRIPTTRNKGKAKAHQLTPTVTDQDNSVVDDPVPTEVDTDDEHYDGPLFTQVDEPERISPSSHPFEIRASRSPKSSQINYEPHSPSRVSNQPQPYPPSTPPQSSSRTLHHSSSHRDPNHISISQLMSPGSTQKVANSLKKISRFIDKNNAHSPEAMRMSYENLKTFIDQMDTKKKEMIKEYMRGSSVWEEVRKDMEETFRRLRENSGKATEEEVEQLIAEAKAKVYRDRGSPIPHSSNEPRPFVSLGSGSEASGTDDEREPVEVKPKTRLSQVISGTTPLTSEHEDDGPSRQRHAEDSERSAHDSTSPSSSKKQSPIRRPRHSGPQIFAAPQKIEEILNRYNVTRSGPSKRAIAEPRTRDSLFSSSSSLRVDSNISHSSGVDKGKAKAKARDIFDDDLGASHTRRPIIRDIGSKSSEDIPRFDLRKLAAHSKLNGNRRSSLPARTHIPSSANDLSENRLSLSISRLPQANTPHDTPSIVHIKASESDQSTLVNALVGSLSSKYQLAPDFVYSVWKDVVDITETERILEKLSRNLSQSKTEMVDESRRRRSLPNSIASTPRIDSTNLLLNSSSNQGMPAETGSRHSSNSQASPAKSRPLASVTSTRQSSSPPVHSSSRRDATQQIQHHKKPRRSSDNRRSSGGQFTPLTVNDSGPESDYSPPRASRAGQMLRLMKQGRREEAIEREHRRASLGGIADRHTGGGDQIKGSSLSRSPEVRTEARHEEGVEREHRAANHSRVAERHVDGREQLNGVSSSKSPEVKREARRKDKKWEGLQDGIPFTFSPREIRKIDDLENLYGDDFTTSMTVKILERML